jgi:pimeloyl-ACP methyl ester carboxylesterase
VDGAVGADGAPASVRIDVTTATLAGQRWPGRGPRVVLLHAGIADSRGWHAVGPALGRTADVLAYDRRGYGETTPSRGSFRHVDDLAAVLEWFGGDAVLAGSSMGGGVAFDLALTRPELVRGLVLLAPDITAAPPPRVFDAESDAQRGAFRAAVEGGRLAEANRLRIRTWLDGAHSAEGRVGDPARALALAMDATVLDNKLDDDAGASGVDAWRRLEEVTVPTTVAWGELDVPYLVDQCETAAARIPNAKAIALPGVAHYPFLEKPDAVVAIIIAALGT